MTNPGKNCHSGFWTIVDYYLVRSVGEDCYPTSANRQSCILRMLSGKKVAPVNIYLNRKALSLLGEGFASGT
jgi:hypothetical protein